MSQNKAQAISLKTNPCIPQNIVHPYCPVAVETENDKYIFSRELKDIYKKTGDGEDDFVIESKIVTTQKIDRQEYIESFRDDVGILNIMKKVALTDDVTLLNQRTRQTLAVDEDGKEVVTDISQLGDQEFAKNYLLNVQQMLASMDPEMRDAITNMSGDELKAYLESKINNGSDTNKNENKDGDK